MSNENMVREQLKEMAKLTILSKRISEVHERNMRAYPFIFFNDVRSIKIEYDLLDTKGDQNNNNAPKNDSWVAYYIELEENSQNNLDKRFTALETSIRDLFWKEVRLIVYFNSLKVYESK